MHTHHEDVDRLGGGEQGTPRKISIAHPTTITMTRLILLLVSLTGMMLELGPVSAKDPTQPPKTSIWKVQPVPIGDGKFAIEAATFSVGDPVHEKITLHALTDGGILTKGTISESEAAVQFIRGVFWNDDPCAQLLTENDFSPLHPSLGVNWYLDFVRAERQAKNGQEIQVTCSLLGKSHFGELQFLHSMADRDGVRAVDTVERMLKWASVAYRIALGEIDYRKPLKTDPVANSLFPSIAEMSASRLLRAKTKSDTRLRAFGSLLHMVQDSYARGHVIRVPESVGQPPGIIQFLSYISQDAAKHGHDDSWRDGADNLEALLKIPGAQNALVESTELVRLYKARTPWQTVESYLRTGPFFVRLDAKNAGPVQ